MEVYTRVHRDEVKRCGGKIIDVRWADVNKTDQTNPEYRSRLVGKEYRRGTEEALYAATPPLEALRAIISCAATHDPQRQQQQRQPQARPRQRDAADLKHIMINDVRRAYCYSTATRDLFINLPKEDETATTDQVGRLNLSLYGTRDAAANWQETLPRHRKERIQARDWAPLCVPS